MVKRSKRTPVPPPHVNVGEDNEHLAFERQQQLVSGPLHNKPAAGKAIILNQSKEEDAFVASKLTRSVNAQMASPPVKTPQVAMTAQRLSPRQLEPNFR